MLIILKTSYTYNIELVNPQLLGSSIAFQYTMCGNGMIGLRYQPALGARLKGVAM